MLQDATCLFCSVVFSHEGRRDRPRRFCSLSCANQNQARVTSKYVHREVFQKCEGCGADFRLLDGVIRKFCTKSCSVRKSSSLRVPSDDHRKNTSESLRRFHAERASLKPVFEKSCVTCGTTFKPRKRSNQNCSPTCVLASRMEGMRRGGLLSASRRVLRSKDEIALYDLCLARWSSTTSNEVLKDGWDADIVIRERMTCILWNGPWHYRQLAMPNHSLSQVQTRDRIKIDLLTGMGWRVLVFEDRDYTPESAFELLSYLLNNNASIA